MRPSLSLPLLSAHDVDERELTLLGETCSGFPNLEVHPNDPYSRDGWNLNNLPILSGSLLRYVKSDISGMTIPWIYVGMVFSTFAWHKVRLLLSLSLLARLYIAPTLTHSLLLTHRRTTTATASTTTTSAIPRRGTASPARTTRSSRRP